MVWPVSFENCFTHLSLGTQALRSRNGIRNHVSRHDCRCIHQVLTAARLDYHASGNGFLFVHSGELFLDSSSKEETVTWKAYNPSDPLVLWSLSWSAWLLLMTFHNDCAFNAVGSATSYLCRLWKGCKIHPQWGPIFCELPLESTERSWTELSRRATGPWQRRFSYRYPVQIFMSTMLFTRLKGKTFFLRSGARENGRGVILCSAWFIYSL